MEVEVAALLPRLGSSIASLYKCFQLISHGHHAFYSAYHVLYRRSTLILNGGCLTGAPSTLRQSF